MTGCIGTLIQLENCLGLDSLKIVGGASYKSGSSTFQLDHRSSYRSESISGISGVNKLVWKLTVP